MKIILILMLLLMLGLFPRVFGQPGEGPLQEKRGPRPHAETERNGQRPAPVLEYLKQLKESDPEKYARLERLRENDPEAFRNELRKKAWGRGEGMKNRFRDRHHPLQSEIDKVKSAATPEEREVAVQELRAKVKERVMANLKEREAAIEKFREQLKQLEEQNEQERIRREEIIDHHLQRILENIDSPPPNE